MWRSLSYRNKLHHYPNYFRRKVGTFDLSRSPSEGLRRTSLRPEHLPIPPYSSTSCPNGTVHTSVYTPSRVQKEKEWPEFVWRGSRIGRIGVPKSRPLPDSYHFKRKGSFEKEMDTGGHFRDRVHVHRVSKCHRRDGDRERQIRTPPLLRPEVLGKV